MGYGGCWSIYCSWSVGEYLFYFIDWLDAAGDRWESIRSIFSGNQDLPRTPEEEWYYKKVTLLPGLRPVLSLVGAPLCFVIMSQKANISLDFLIHKSSVVDQNGRCLDSYPANFSGSDRIRIQIKHTGKIFPSTFHSRPLCLDHCLPS